MRRIRHRVLARLALAASLHLLVACGGESAHVELPEASRSRSFGVSDADAGSERVAECDGAPMGTPCGHPGDRMHCVYDACVRNACGDGWPAEGEACDDGNERDHDGCSARCTMEVAPGCGNGVLEPGEECDDGNATAGDRCEAACTRPVAATAGGAGGAGGVGGAAGSSGAGGAGGEGGSSGEGGAGGASGAGGSSGEGGTSGASGAGGSSGAGGAGGASGAGGTSGEGGAGAAGGTSGAGGAGGTGGTGGMPPEACDDCRNVYCRAWEGAVDLVAGCFEAVNTELGATADPTFLQNCVDAVDCAYANGCGFSLARGPIECYCGSNATDTCQVSGPAADAKCVSQWQAATRGASNNDVLNNFSELSLPAGWAFYLLTCDATYCNDNPLGDCTP